MIVIVGSAGRVYPCDLFQKLGHSKHEHVGIDVSCLTVVSDSRYFTYE